MKHFFQSLRWQLQLWHGLLLGIVVTGLLSTFYTLQREQTLSRLDQQVQSWTPRIAEALRQLRPPRPVRPGQPRNPMESDWLKELVLPTDIAPFFDAEGETKAYYSIWDPMGRILTFSESTPKMVPYPEIAQGRRLIRTRDSYKEIASVLPEGTTILVGTPLEPAYESLRILRFQLFGVGAGILAISLMGGWWFITRSIRPISSIRHTARAISEGHLEGRISIQNAESELGQLSKVLNDTFERLEASFSQQVRFTADASHELRTPISVIRSKTQLALSRERSPEEYREAIHVCQRSAERMGELVESLLELARIDSGEAKTESTPFDILNVILESVELVQAMAKESGITLVVPEQSCQVMGVSMWTQQVITNLLVNAIRYCPETEEIQIEIDQSSSSATVTIRDFGPGIPSADLPHLFERFFRVDRARSRTQGGSGLGLSISRSLMEAQEGSIEAQSTIGKGSQFSISLPIAIEDAGRPPE